LEEELNRAVSYDEISNVLKITRASARGYISDLILKKIPITKQTSSKRKVFLSIDPALRNLKMLENLLTLKERDRSRNFSNQNLGHFF